MKTLITEHIGNIFKVIKEALGSADEHFIDEEKVQDQIYQLLDGLTPSDKTVFKNRVRTRITDAKFLKKQSLDYLIHAEYLNDMIVTRMLDDFSPYVLQMSRAVESELLNWVFIPFTNFIRTEHPNIKNTYSKDLHHKDMKLFASKLNAGDKSYTLGNMHFILIKTANAYIRDSSELTSDFHYYLIENFSGEILSSDFLDEVNNLLKNFRNKSAHTDRLTSEQAKACEHLVRKILLMLLKIVK